MKKPIKVIPRHKYPARVAHWLVVLCFFITVISGLGFMFPSLRWMTHILGTPQLAQFLHPIFGMVMILGLFVLFIYNVTHSFPEKGDATWLKNVAQVLKGREHEVADVGQYNAGQKMLFWAIMTLGLLLICTGLIAWQPYFAPRFPVYVVRISIFIHSLAAVLLILSIMVHMYMAFWYKGTLRGMVQGTVTRGWAKLHHPRWLRKIEASEKTERT